MSLMLQMLRKLRSISTIIKWPSQDNLFGTATATTVHVHVYKTLKVFQISKSIKKISIISENYLSNVQISLNLSLGCEAKSSNL